VNMLRHDDVAEEAKLVTPAQSIQCDFKGYSGSVVVEIGEAAITTEGEEVMMAFGLVSLETARHEEGFSGSETG
jgi:hypothetical protein